MAAAPPDPSVRLDYPGIVLSALGLGGFVFGLLKSGTYGFIQNKPGAPSWLGLSPSFWLMVGGVVVLWLFLGWEQRVVDAGKEPLVDPALWQNRTLTGGLTGLFFQFLLQGGLFYLIALYLTVALGLSAIATGLRLMPLSLALLAAAVGIPRLFPGVSPRKVARAGFVFLLSGVLVLMVLLHWGTGPAIVTWPLMLAGLGIGCLASQLGAVVASSVPDERTGEVGGLQNTATNIGASIATALAGAVLIGALTTSFLDNLANNPNVPASVVEHATIQLSAGVPFVSDAQLGEALASAGVASDVADGVMQANSDARVRALRTSLGLLALMGVIALFMTSRIPDVAAAASGGVPEPSAEPD
jgi:hypothetical protein